MFTYQVRPRRYRTENGGQLTFPSPCEIRFHFQPPQPFGVSSSGGHTIVKAVEASVLFNATSGHFSAESKQPLTPLDVTIQGDDDLIVLNGTTLTISRHFASLSELDGLLSSIYFVLPSVLNIPFTDPPFIERVDGTVGQTAFSWLLDGWTMEFLTTTQEQQEQAIIDAFERLNLMHLHRRRLAAALHYFHVACRLSRVGEIAGEFVAEVLLNLSKSLEVLFPPSGDGKSRDAVRRGLRSLGFSDSQIECDFLPAMAFRNEIDVGHVELGLFKMGQLKTLHAFTERAENAFRELFNRIFDGIAAGTFEIASHVLGPPSKAAVKLISRLQKNMIERKDNTSFLGDKKNIINRTMF